MEQLIKMDEIIDIRPVLTDLDETITKVIKQLFLAYNQIAKLPLETAPKHDLDQLKKLVQTLRDMHCAVSHNESVANARSSAREYWIESHHSIFIRIRDHIADMDDKVPLEFNKVHKAIETLHDLCTEYVRQTIDCQLKQQFFVRVALYRYHLKALSMHCVLYDCFLPFLQNGKTIESEQTRMKIMQRILDLGESFKDKPHALQLRTETLPHADFTKFL